MDERQLKSFLLGLALGLGAMSILTAPRFSAKNQKDEGIASDWKAVGGDIRDSMNRFGKGA